MGAEGVNDPGPGAETLDVQTSQTAVLTVMRLFRALERVDTGLTPQQYRILKLAGAGGERSARLAERLGVAKPTLTATADGLVAAGYAQREAEAGDRRVVRLCLTAAGRAALERADAAYADWLGPLLGATGDMAGGLEVIRGPDSAMGGRRPSRGARCLAAAAGGLLLAAPPSRDHGAGRVAAGHPGPGGHPADHGVDRGQRDP